MQRITDERLVRVVNQAGGSINGILTSVNVDRNNMERRVNIVLEISMVHNNSDNACDEMTRWMRNEPPIPSAIDQIQERYQEISNVLSPQSKDVQSKIDPKNLQAQTKKHRSSVRPIDTIDLDIDDSNDEEYWT